MNKYLLVCCLALSAASFTAAAPPATPPPDSAPGHAPKKGAAKPAADDAKAAATAVKAEKADKAEKKKAADPEKSATEVDGDQLDYDKPTNIAIFTGNVHVKNPEFDMTCDKLTAYLRHAEPPPPAGAGAAKPAASATPAPAKATATPAKAAATPAPTGGKAAEAKQKTSALQKALAEGSVVIVQDKTDTNGNVEHDIAHAKVADYNADTGDVILRGKPDAQQGGNQVISLDDSTIIILNRDGNMTVHGPHKVLLHDTSDAPASAAPEKPSDARPN